MKLPFCSEGIRPLQRSMVAHIEKLKNRSVVCTADSAAVLDALRRCDHQFSTFQMIPSLYRSLSTILLECLQETGTKQAQTPQEHRWLVSQVDMMHIPNVFLRYKMMHHVSPMFAVSYLCSRPQQIQRQQPLEAQLH